MKTRLLTIILTLAVTLPIVPAHAETSSENTAAAYGTGANAVTDETKAKLREHNAQPTVSLSAILPSSIDNSATKYFPPIANQGSDNSCVGFATTYYQMTYSVAKAMNASYSEYTFAPNWTYSLTNEGVDNGADIYKAYNVLSKLGAAKKTEFTGSKTSIETNTDVWKSAMKYRLGVNNNAWHIHEFANVPSFIEEAKTALADGKILVTGSNSGRWQIGSAKVGTSNQKIITHVRTSGAANRHFVTLVGYDDNIIVTVNGKTTKGAFKMANSWGTAWGNNGFIWVAYDAFTKNNGEGFVSAWWNPDDKNAESSMFMTIDLSSNYKPYTPSYIAELTYSSKTLDSTCLTYKTKEDAKSGFSADADLFNSVDYGFSNTKPYTGTIAVDASVLSAYITDNTKYYEIADLTKKNPSLAIKNNDDITISKTHHNSPKRERFFLYLRYTSEQSFRFKIKQ